jgi:hypothetical protein
MSPYGAANGLIPGRAGRRRVPGILTEVVLITTLHTAPCGAGGSRTCHRPPGLPLRFTTSPDTSQLGPGISLRFLTLGGPSRVVPSPDGLRQNPTRARRRKKQPWYTFAPAPSLVDGAPGFCSKTRYASS